jgi:hypothetical protein
VDLLGGLDRNEFRIVGAGMIINQTRIKLLAVFWLVIIGSQYYFLYHKFHALSACRVQHGRVDAIQAQMEKTDALINRLKKEGSTR